jgi:hypothetical protein
MSKRSEVEEKPEFGLCASCGEPSGIILPDDDHTQLCGPCCRRIRRDNGAPHSTSNLVVDSTTKGENIFSALQKGEGRKNVAQASETTRAPLASGASFHNSQRRCPSDAVELAPIAGAAGVRRMPH